MIAARNFSKGSYRDNGTKLFLVMADEIRGTGHKLLFGRLGMSTSSLRGG